MRRAIQREIEDQLSEKILFGEIGPGQIVVVDVEDPVGEGRSRDKVFTFAGQEKPSPVPDTLPVEEQAG